MRKTEEKQLPLTPIWPDHPLGDELRTVSRILEQNPRIGRLIMADLSDSDDPRGAKGMGAEQVLRCAVLKNWQGFSYRELAFHLADSYSLRAFARLPSGWTPSPSCLQENISRLSERTLEKINAVLVGWAVEEGLEDGSQMRGDSTAVAAPLHHPTDSSLLRDSVRVIARLLRKLRECGRPVRFSNHLRRAKKRHLEISKVRGKEKKRKRYEDLLKVSRWTLGYAERALESTASNRKTAVLLGQLQVFAERLRRVISQTERRVLHGEKVPASEKLFSIFETHADIIKKGGREAVYGHKVFISCGRSPL
ncbi:MAG TPA: transposase, partial [Acidobacteriota bacterium]|nr:transposase [Acidobacteriota bacterium]